MKNKVRKERIQQGLSQKDLAKLIGMHPSHLSALENGKRNMPLWRRKVCAGLQKPEEELFPVSKGGIGRRGY